MEHSKGNLEGNDIFPWDLWIGADKHLFTVHGEREVRRANSIRLKKCWNEHDELVKKAEMFDGLVDVLEIFIEADDCNTHVLPRTIKDAKALLAKAKAVS